MTESNGIGSAVKVVPMARDGWVVRGLCRSSDLGPDAWFPPDDSVAARLPTKSGQPTQLTEAQKAQQTCRACPVSRECLLGALGRDERFGIWGGLTTRQRDKFVREALKQASA